MLGWENPAKDKEEIQWIRRRIAALIGIIWCSTRE